MKKCPLCDGLGKVDDNRKRPLKENRKLAYKMRKLGFSYWDITKALGYKSPRSAYQLIKSYKKSL